MSRLFTKSTTSDWPVLEKMVELQCLGYVDLALAQRLLSIIEGDQSTASLICHLSLAARQGHLCVTIHEETITPSIEELWRSPLDTSTHNEAWSEIHQLVLDATLSLPPTLVCDVLQEECHAPICRCEERYYLQRHWVMETSCIEQLQSLLAQATPTLSLSEQQVQEAVDRLLSSQRLQPEQAHAVIQGCSSAFSVITGGPGTGKTYTAGMLLRTIWELFTPAQRAKCRIALAAPTGKAAANLEISIRKASFDLAGFPSLIGQTLHSLLGINKYSVNSSVLDVDLLLVDESSMVDIRLMTLLLQSLKPGVRLILLGDPCQLPSIEGGSLFADLVTHLRQTENPCLTALKTCMRAELRSIVDIAEAVNSGDFCLLEKQISHFGPWEQALSVKQQQRSILKYASKFPQIHGFPDHPEAILNSFSQFRILTPLRQGPLGVEELNRQFFQAAASQAQHAECFVVPIIIARNQANLKLFNGEMGLLVKFKDASRDIALFSNENEKMRFRQIPAILLPAFEFAYCISIHKSQGSEFDHVLVALPEGSEIFGRESLYTAVTRAKRSLEIWAKPEVVQKMIQRTAQRHSGIVASLSHFFSFCAFAYLCV